MTIDRFQQLIKELPPLNRQLLLYILDLLAVFASKADINRMTSANLAAIFQPGMLSHPQHDMSPPDYRLSQDVIIFLIDNQDSFLIGMTGTAADEKTVRDVQGGPQNVTTPTKASQAGLGRSASNASAGADRLSGIRRNISVSSKNSRNSAHVQTPNTPSSGVFAAASTGNGVYRSNTVPSKRSPALSSTRRGRGLDSPTTPIALGSPSLAPPARSMSPVRTPNKAANRSETTTQGHHLTPVSNATAIEQPSIGVTPAPENPTKPETMVAPTPNDGTPSTMQQGDLGAQAEELPLKGTRGPGLLAKSPTNDSKDGRQPNKLKKRRGPSSTHASANSSSHSLQAVDDSFRSVPANTSQGPPVQETPAAETEPPAPVLATNTPTPTATATTASHAGGQVDEPAGPATLESAHVPSDSTLKPKSPTGSVHSKSSVTDLSEHDQSGQASAGKPEKKKRWRFSSAAKHKPSASITSPRLLGTNGGAGISASSVGSGQKGRKSTSNDIPPASLDTTSSVPTQQSSNSEVGGVKEKELQEEQGEKKGIFGRFKAKVAQATQDRKEKDAEKARAKSPPRNDTEHGSSKQSLSAMAHDLLPPRGRSIDAVVADQQGHEGASEVPAPAPASATAPLATTAEATIEAPTAAEPKTAAP